MKIRERSCFQNKVLNYYKKNGRTFPWRDTRDPYHILVSEFMLQQTQTIRIASKYGAFLDAFPTIRDLSESTFSNVLSLWHGIGYNRRAKYLHDTARIIVRKFNAIIPRDVDTLDSLPGIGPYTAAAISTFSYNKANTMIETNIRAVFIHEFFPCEKKVSDNEIIPLIKKTIFRKDPRTWYYALMDYGAMLKETTENPNRKSKHYIKQKPFKGSRREIRGKILQTLLQNKESSTKIAKMIETSLSTTENILNDLANEGLITKDDKGIYQLSD